MDYKIIGRLNLKQIQNCFAKILTDEVMLREERVEHIKQRRGEEFYERYAPLFNDIVANPDYILQDKKPNTILMCKRIVTDGISINLVIKLVVVGDNPLYKNSIITAVGEKDKRFRQRLRNMGIIYERLD